MIELARQLSIHPRTVERATRIMRLARQLLETFALAIAAGTVMAVFHYFGGFTFRASLLLGICFTIVALWIYQLYRIAMFEPYGLQFFINFEALREDLGMVKATEPIDPEEIPHELYNFADISAALFVHYREPSSE
jgi:AAA+ ATPase superfamily predicted ATPase